MRHYGLRVTGCGLFFVLFVLFVVNVAQAERLHPEKWYQERWCERHGGQMEVVLPDKTRCDCVTTTHAIEFDFADKWAEALGQALHYSLMTSKQAGIVLILLSESDWKYYYRLMSVIVDNGLQVKVWVMMEK